MTKKVAWISFVVLHKRINDIINHHRTNLFELRTLTLKRIVPSALLHKMALKQRHVLETQSRACLKEFLGRTYFCVKKSWYAAESKTSLLKILFLKLVLSLWASWPRLIWGVFDQSFIKPFAQVNSTRPC